MLNLGLTSKINFRYRNGIQRIFSSTEATSNPSTRSNKKNISISKELTSYADTVIIGGGVCGVSIAYHLARQKPEESVVLLEKSELTAGSTWHAAGLVTLFHPGINVKRIHYYSMNFYTHIQRETGQNVGFHRPGSIRLATTPTRVDEIRYQLSRQGWHSSPQKFLTPEEIKKKVPIIDVDGANIMGGLFHPFDGHIDPYSLTQAISIGARKHGALIKQGCEVTGAELNSDGSWEINTPQGCIKAGRVINAAGFWAKELAALCGMPNLPLVPVQHQYLVTKSVPEVSALAREIPVLRSLEDSFYLRQERDGLLIGVYESQNRVKQCENWVKDGVTPGFGKELFEADLDRIQPYIEQAMKLVPCFQSAEIKTVVNGPITYTPDILPMVGPTQLPNMWLAVGFSYGIVHAGGVGKYLADWILNGEPSYDLIEFDPLRYGSWANDSYTLAKTRESYGMNNAIGFPNEEREAGRPTTRISGVHDELLAEGAFMGFHSGWEQPDWFADMTNSTSPLYKPSFQRTNWHDAVLREYEMISASVGIVDLSPFAKFLISGVSSRAFLDHLLAGSIPKEGRTSIAHALTPLGKVYAEFTVTALPNDSYMVVTGSGSELHDLRYCNELIRTEGWKDVYINNITEETGVLSVVGPNAGLLLARITSPEIVQNWKFLDAKQLEIKGVNCLCIRWTFTGELGWEIYAPKSDIKIIYDAIMRHRNDFQLVHFGTRVINTFRLEKGFKVWGNEMNCDCTALEAGLDPFIRWKKETNFIGREALMRSHANVLMQKLVLMSVDTNKINSDPEGNESIWLCGKVIGNTTSGAYSPAIGKSIVFAYVPSYVDAVNVEGLEVEVMGHLCPAMVLDAPPVLIYSQREKKKS